MSKTSRVVAETVAPVRNALWAVKDKTSDFVFNVSDDLAAIEARKENKRIRRAQRKAMVGFLKDFTTAVKDPDKGNAPF